MVGAPGSADRARGNGDQLPSCLVGYLTPVWLVGWGSGVPSASGAPGRLAGRRLPLDGAANPQVASPQLVRCPASWPAGLLAVWPAARLAAWPAAHPPIWPAAHPSARLAGQASGRGDVWPDRGAGQLVGAPWRSHQVVSIDLFLVSVVLIFVSVCFSLFFIVDSIRFIFPGSLGFVPPISFRFL